MSTQDNINEIAKVIQKAMTAQEAASRGLVPQSGNPDKPGRWIKDPKAEAGSQKEGKKEITADAIRTVFLKRAITEVAEEYTALALESLERDGRLEDMTRRDAEIEIASTIGEIVSHDYEGTQSHLQEAYDFDYIRENVPEAEFVITQILDRYEWKDERS